MFAWYSYPTEDPRATWFTAKQTKDGAASVCTFLNWRPGKIWNSINVCMRRAYLPVQIIISCYSVCSSNIGLTLLHICICCMLLLSMRTLINSRRVYSPKKRKGGSDEISATNKISRVLFALNIKNLSFPKSILVRVYYLWRDFATNCLSILNIDKSSRQNNTTRINNNTNSLCTCT